MVVEFCVQECMFQNVLVSGIIINAGMSNEKVLLNYIIAGRST